MKTSRLLGSLLLSCLMITGYAEVNFHEGDFASLLAEAKKLNKPILIDAFTVWCGPCKMLDRDVFQNEEASEYINKNFVAYKVDMEKGEGPSLAMKFRVNAYPSTLFLSPEGKLIAKKIGFSGKEGYLNWCKDIAGNKEKPYDNIVASKMDLDYPEFYEKSFTSDKWKRKRASVDQINEYLDGQKDLFSEVNWSVISVLSYYPHNRLDWVVENSDHLKTLYPEDEVNGVIERIVGNKADSIAKLGLADGDLKIKALLKEYKLDDPELEKNSLINYYFKAEQWSKLLDYANETAENGVPNPGMMNSVCWAIYEKSDDKVVLKKAASAMELALKEENHPNYIDTLAHLYFKSGDVEKARRTAKEALLKGKEAGMEMKETEELLDMVQ